MKKDQELIFYVNGRHVSESNAMVSVLDHGFLYGDGVYETLILVNRKIFKLNEHIDRLFDSLKIMKMDVSESKEEIKEIVKETVRKNQVRDAYLRVVITRGVGYPLLDPRYCEKPSIIVIPSILKLNFIPGHRELKGLSAAIVKVKKTPSSCLESRVKSLNYLNNILARMEATEAGADEAIMLDVQGFVAEGPGDNIFIARRNVVCTPYSTNVLDGITRRTVIELAEREGYKAIEKNLTPYDLITADEVFVTSTAGGVIPVIKVDGRIIGNGLEGPITKKIRELYLKELEKGIKI